MRNLFGRALALVVTLLLAAVLVLVWARVIGTLTEAVAPRPPIGQPRAVVWHDRVFTTDRQLRGFLDARGISYTRWLSRHPSVLGILRTR